MKQIFRYYILYLLMAFGLNSCEEGLDKDAIVIENPEFKLVIGNDARAISLLHKSSGQECLQKGTRTPVFALTQYRPYDNENFLTYPAKQKTFYADTVYWKGNDLIVGFELETHLARIGVTITDYYIGFKLLGFEYEIENYGVKRKTEIDEFTLLQLPVKDRKNFGEWLNVSWDDKVAVNILATDVYAKIDAEERETYHIMKAGMESQVKLLDVGAALITTTSDKLLDCIDKAEMDYGMPRGVQSRRANEYRYSYFVPRNVTPQNIDDFINFAQKGGFRTMVVYYPYFASTMGHFLWNEKYTGGLADLKFVTEKIKGAGMIPGFHFHYNKASIDDPYVSPIPDPRLNLVRYFTLADAINQTSVIITVEENPEGCTMEKGRQFLKIGDELVAYESYSTSPPYQFNGCKRGELGSKGSAYAKGFKFGLLDVDTWPRFVRLDQNTSIQQEVAKNIGDIYTNAGFRFAYFDGAEDVHPPYWYNVSKAQLEVFNNLNPKPLFSEGACKSHYSWHILTRGNAFDIFPPEYIKEATDKYPVAAAKYTAQDFTSINFGWINYAVPNEKTIGLQPDMLEYVCSRAAAWDCPIALAGELKNYKLHPRTADNLEVIRRWEEAKINNFLSEKQKKSLQDLGKEHTLLINEEGNFELAPYKPIDNVANKNEEVRAFIFTRKNKTWVTYWHCRGEAELVLPVSPEKMQLFEELGKEGPVQNKGTNVVVPVGKRRYLAFDLSSEKVAEIFEQAEIRQ